MNNWQKSQQLIIAARRQKVSSLRLRGLRPQAIHLALANPATGMLNPETGEPWSLRTIKRDLAVLRKQWKQEAAQNIKMHQARQLAELKEHRLSAWADRELSEVRLGLALEVKLLGTAAPERREISGPGGGEIPIKYVVFHQPPELGDKDDGDDGQDGHDGDSGTQASSEAAALDS